MTCSHQAELGMDGVCFACSEAEHRARHPELAPGCGTCRLQSLQWSPAAHPSKNTAYKVAPRKPSNSWEKGVVGQHRPDGSFMPYLKDGHEVTTKDAANLGSKFDDYKRAVHSGQ